MGVVAAANHLSTALPYPCDLRARGCIVGNADSRLGMSVIPPHENGPSSFLAWRGKANAVPGRFMAGISVSLDGANIQLSFQKDDQATAVVMDARAARALMRAVGQLLTAIDDPEEADEHETADALGEDIAMLEVTSSAIEVGTDEQGQPVIALQAGALPPFQLRLSDEEARHVATSLTEILNAPRDVRASHGGH